MTLPLRSPQLFLLSELVAVRIYKVLTFSIVLFFFGLLCYLVFAMTLSVNIGRIPEARFLIIKEVKRKKAEGTLFYWLEQKILEAALQVWKLRPSAYKVSQGSTYCVPTSVLGPLSRVISFNVYKNLFRKALFNSFCR